MVLRKEIRDGRVGSNKEHSANTDISRYHLNRNNHVITRHLCHTTLTIRNVK